MKKVRLVLLGQSAQIDLINLASSLNAVQETYDFASEEKDDVNLRNTASAPDFPNRLAEAAAQLAASPPVDHVFVVCSYATLDYFYYYLSPRITIINLNGWSHFARYPADKAIAFFAAGSLASSMLPTPTHSRPRGCPNDECNVATEINVGLTRCDFCRECRSIIVRKLVEGRIPMLELASIYKLLDFAADRKRCFVIMPFAPALDSVYAQISSSLPKKGWLCSRADEIFEIREIVGIITEAILVSDLVVADLTGKNANVFYELGYAHASQKQTILITQNIDDVPFDLRHRQLIEYSPENLGLAKLKRALRQYFS